jgi:solute carrier family 39 (zinc transporter), member 1/2/3
MHLILLKVVAATSIFLLTLTTGLLPLKLAKNKAHLLCLGDAFASGVFLSAALLHLLPEADAGFRQIASSGYPFAQLICIATFVFLLIMEHSVFACGKRFFPESKIVAPLMLVLLLGLHSLVEGAAIGTGTNIAETSMLFFAVIAHKGSESFALAVNLRRYELSTKNIRRIIALFSFITPLGIFIASLVMYTLHSNSGNTIESVFNSIAAGTFLYLGVEHLVDGKDTCKGFIEILALMAGVGLMALVAIWV